ncbi:hypothetical protein SAMN04489712_104120 [Thermomonospora echinospora]|uniref:Uncharacterized protein n=1 Tax=Thermomonospora echinospora TaxID=1992 RepID=A0A1H5YPU0_9ACTN|nr:hypothetical protein SAMN04489712_104120 [Thermomonospora echinospora]
MDREWVLWHISELGVLVPLRLGDGEPKYLNGEAADFDSTRFLADCLSFDHDLPTVVLPFFEQSHLHAPYEPIGSHVPWRNSGQGYLEVLQMAADQVTQLRFSDPLQVRYSEEGDPLTRFKQRFDGKGEPLGLYAMAIRQVDVLAEYLFLYRIAEWADRKNGKTFIGMYLDLIHDYDFGELWTISPPIGPAADQPEINVFDVYREQALGRIESLRTAGVDVADWLYGFRNRLAHGKEGIMVREFGMDADAVAADLPLLKLLARIAIESG